jgi:hypothetical protein
MQYLQFKKFEDKHFGERCFILGNAPSLKKENLSLLKNEIVFVCNKGYNALSIGLPKYDYYVCTDTISVYSEDFYNIKHKVNAVRFYPKDIIECEQYHIEPKEDYIPINYISQDVKKTKEEKRAVLNGIFPKSYEDGWSKIGSVTFHASMIAYFMGFKEIYFLGMAFDYLPGQSHFYSGVCESERESNLKNTTHKGGLIYAAAMSKFFKEQNISFVNLSKDFQYTNLMDIDSLENVIQKKDNLK